MEAKTEGAFGPEMRTIEMAARPGAVAGAKMVSLCEKRRCFAAIWEYMSAFRPQEYELRSLQIVVDTGGHERVAPDAI